MKSWKYFIAALFLTAAMGASGAAWSQAGQSQGRPGPAVIQGSGADRQDGRETGGGAPRRDSNAPDRQEGGVPGPESPQPSGGPGSSPERINNDDQG